MNIDWSKSRVVSALHDCVSVMERELNGLTVIQPELANAKEALALMVKDEFDGRQEWSGEGQPPVGTELECGFACEGFKTWHKGVCVAIGIDPECRDEICVVKSGDKIAMYTTYGGRMRPIRTPEQIAAEEREVAIQQMIADTNILTGIMSDRRTMAGQLYDAGYRKQVTP